MTVSIVETGVAPVMNLMALFLEFVQIFKVRVCYCAPIN